MTPDIWLPLLGSAEGRDCWALHAEVYRRRGITLVGIDPIKADDWRIVDVPEAGDSILTVADGRPHVGVCVSPTEFVHADRANRVRKARIASLVRAGSPVKFYRHNGALAVTVPPATGSGVLVVWLPDIIREPSRRESWYREPGTLRQTAPAGANVVLTPDGPRNILDLPDRSLVVGETVVYAMAPQGLDPVTQSLLIGIGLGLLSAGLQLLLAPSVPSSRKDDPSPTFDLDGLRNTATSGLVQPVVYGEHRTGGNFISSFQKIDAQGRAVFYGAILLSRGPIHSVAGLTADADELTGSAIPSAIEIDGNPASGYDAKVSVRLGGTEQGPIPGFAETATAFPYSAQLVQSAPFGHQTSTAVDGFDALVTYPSGLVEIDDDTGDPFAITIAFTVRWRVLGTTTWTSETWNHTAAKTAQISFQFSKRGLTRDLYEIQVERTSGPAPFPRQSSDSYMLGVNEIIAAGFSHPGCAILAVRLVGSDQLAGGIPQIAATIKGRTVYVWDGVSESSPAFGTAEVWTDNPAWIVLDVLLNKDYGLGRGGRLTLNNIDLGDFEAWADNCDDMVDDGRGGTFARARCDMVIDTERSGFALAQEIAFAAWGRLYWAGNKIKVWLDDRTTPAFLFTAGNVRECKIGYIGRRQRPNACEVSYANEEVNYDQDIVSRFDESAILTAGQPVSKETVEGTGVTRPGQAARLATSRLNHARLETKRVDLVSGPESAHLLPGDVCYVHTSALGVGHGGRLLAATRTTVKLDRAVTAAARVRLIVGSQVDALETVYIPAGTYARDTAIGIVDSGGTSTSFTDTPAAGSKWALASLTTVNTNPVAFRIDRIEGDATLTRTISGPVYDADIYDDDPGDVETFTDALPNRKGMPSSVTGLRVTATDGDCLRVAFEPVNQWDSAEVWYRNAAGAAGAWTFAGWSRGDLLIPVAVNETYEVAVPARSAAGTRQTLDAAARASCHVRGRRAAPDAPAAVLAAVTAAGILTVTITAPDDATVAGYEIRHGLRLVAETGGPEWSGPCPFTGTGTISVRSVSRYGVPSATAVAAAVTWTLAPSVFTLDLDVDEDPSWPGNLDDLTLTGSELEITGTALTGVYTQDDNTPTNTTDPQQVVITAVTDLADVAMTVEEATHAAGSAWALAYTLTGGGPFLTGYDLSEHSTVANAMYSLGSMPGLLYTVAGPSDVIAALEPDLAYDDNADLAFTDYPGPFVLASVSTIAAQVTLNRPHSRYEPRLVSLNLTTLDLSDAGGGGGTPLDLGLVTDAVDTIFDFGGVV